MKGINLFDVKQWQPLSYFNIENSFFTLNSETIINTWIALFVLLVGCLIAYRYMTHKQSLVRYAVLSFVRNFVDLCSQAIGYFSFTHTVFITTIFLFITLCNIVAILPFTVEPTKDLNTALSLGILSFIYIQWYAIRSHGPVEYIREYFSPLFIMFPLHVVGKLSSVVSISFRLFGNIFGSAMITHIYSLVVTSYWWTELLGIITGLNIIIVLFFILFEGLLQAFVFTMLTLTYLAIAISPEEEVHKGSI